MQNLTRHLKEAIEINTKRQPLYANLSNGKTVSFSKKLIWYEKLALKGAWIFDRVGDKLQQKGVPYLKAEFVEMHEVADFSETYPAHINYKASLKKVNFSKYHKGLKYELKAKNTAAMVAICERILEDLSNQPHLYCMLRHLIESFGRIAYLIPIQEKLCAQLELKNPSAYSYFLLKMHLLVLKETQKFDEAIAPIQNTGVPFIYQDLPKIEIRGSEKKSDEAIA